MAKNKISKQEIEAKKDEYKGKPSYSNKQSARDTKNESSDGYNKSQCSKKVNRGVKKSKGDMTKQTGNDPMFYGNNAALVENMTNIYFNHPTGFPIPGSKPETMQLGRDASEMAGILTIPLIPTFGDTQSFDAPLSMAGKMIYMAMSSKTGRKSEYQMSDVLQYMMAIDNLYIHLAEAQRVYGLFRMVSQFNRYLPKTLIRALGWDYDDVVANPANFRYQINRVVEMVNQIVIPEFNDLFKVHMSLLNAVYYDHDAMSAKPQHIVFTTMGGGYRYFDELGLLQYGNAAKVYNTIKGPITGPEAHKTFSDNSIGDLYIKGATWTVNNWLTYMLDCISDIMGSEIFTKIGTDLMLRFNTNGFVQLNPIPEDYTTPFVYDVNVMMMLQNATYTGTATLANGPESDKILREYHTNNMDTAHCGVYANYLSRDGINIQAIKSDVGVAAPSVVQHRPYGDKGLMFCGLISSSAADSDKAGIEVLGNIPQANHILNLDFDYQPNGLNLLEATRLMYNLDVPKILPEKEIPRKWDVDSSLNYINRPWYLNFVDYGFWVMLQPQLWVYANDGILTLQDWRLNSTMFQFFKGPRTYTIQLQEAGKLNNLSCDLITDPTVTYPCKSKIVEAVEYQIVSTLDRDLLKKLNYIAVSSVLRVPVNTVPDLRS